jgi:hypothetical protein
MADQPTCGQGLAQNSPLRTKLGELVGSTSGVLEIHMAALDPGDEDTGPERRAYQRLAQEHREIGARLLVLGEEMAGYRDLPMGRHDPRVMASPPAVEAFEKFLQAERELLALLQQRVPQDQRMLEQMRGAGRGT